MKKIFQNLFKRYYTKVNQEFSTKDSIYCKGQIKKSHKEEFSEILSEIDAKKRKEYEEKKSDPSKKKINKTKIRKYIYSVVKGLLKASIEKELELREHNKKSYVTNNDNDKIEHFETSHFSFKMRIADGCELWLYEWLRFGSLALKISDTDCGILVTDKKDYVKIDFMNRDEIPKYVKKYTERYMLKFFNKVEVVSGKEIPKGKSVRMPLIIVKYSEPKFEY
jgi:hypothetical protein